jgi:hypothetical protein
MWIAPDVPDVMFAQLRRFSWGDSGVIGALTVGLRILGEGAFRQMAEK